MASSSNMADLFSKMTKQEPEKLIFDDTQVRMMVELLIPKIIMDMPMMQEANLTCKVTPDDDGWNIRIDKPQ